MDKAVFQKRFYAIVGGGACVLLILTFVHIKGGLTSREFAVSGLIWWIAMFTVLFPLIRSRQRSTEDDRKKQIASGFPVEVIEQDRCVKNIRNMKRLIAVLIFLIGYGILTTQGSPLLPRAAGATFYLFMLVVCILSLMKSQKKLKEITKVTATKPTTINCG
jgi:predicted secreted protein